MTDHIHRDQMIEKGIVLLFLFCPGLPGILSLYVFRRSFPAGGTESPFLRGRPAGGRGLKK